MTRRVLPIPPILGNHYSYSQTVDRQLYPITVVDTRQAAYSARPKPVTHSTLHVVSTACKAAVDLTTSTSYIQLTRKPELPSSSVSQSTNNPEPHLLTPTTLPTSNLAIANSAPADRMLSALTALVVSDGVC